MPQPGQDVTQLLRAWSAGDETALERLIPRVYAELHRLARHYRRREHAASTVQTTALVNEAYLRLIDCDSVTWQDRDHFFALCARMMRRILVDHARSRQRVKRGRGVRAVPLDDAVSLSQANATDVVAVHEALTTLAEVDPRKAHVVELRFFGGLSIDQTAAVLRISEGTVKRDWSLACAWLRRELRRDRTP